MTSLPNAAAGVADYDAAMRLGGGWIVLAVLVGTVAIACYGELHAPPSPTTSRVPTIVGRLAGLEPDGATYRLEGERRVTIGPPAAGASPAAVKLSDGGLTMPAGRGGGLLLYGEDDAGAFWAATEPADDDGCFAMHGQGFIEPNQVHLSSGLVLGLAAKGRPWRNGRSVKQPGASWLLSFDLVCLDLDGHVTFVDQLALGA